MDFFKKLFYFKFNTKELSFDKTQLSIFANFFTIFILTVFALLNFFIRQNYQLALVESFFCFLSIAILVYYFFTKRSTTLIFTTTLILFGISILYFILIPKNLFAGSWLFFFPFVVFFLNNLEQGRMFILLYLVVISGYIYFYGIGTFTDAAGFLNTTFALTLFIFFIYQFEQSRRKAYEKLSMVMQKLEQLSMIDELTQLYNRHFLNKHILQNKDLISKPFLFCITDIDNFKLYNDTYGHQKGDEVLRTIADIKKLCIENKSDSFVFRLGGEEFGAFIFNEQNAKEKLETFIQKVRYLAIEHKENPPYNICTVSIGAVICKEHSSFDFSKIYQLADEALYEAKKRGKNQIIYKDYTAI